MLLHSSIIFINTWRSWSTLKLLYEMSVRSLQLTPALGVSSAVRGCGFAPREKAGNPFGNAEVDFRPRKCLQKRLKSFRTTMSVIFLVKSPSATVQHSISLPPAYLQHSRAKPSYLWGCLVVSLILSGVNQSVHKQVTHSGCPKHSWSNWRQAKTSVLTCWPQRNKHWPFDRGVLCVCVLRCASHRAWESHQPSSPQEAADVLHHCHDRAQGAKHCTWHWRESVFEFLASTQWQEWNERVWKSMKDIYSSPC